MLFYGAGINEHKIIPNQIRIIDIFPTILDMLGINNKPLNFTGISLQNLISGNIQEDRPAYLESGKNHTKQKSSNAIGIRLPNFKYFRDLHDSKNFVYLYDIKNDKNEQKNIALSNPDMCKTLEKYLQSLLSNSVSSNNKTDDLQRIEIEDELKKLGYL